MPCLKRKNITSMKKIGKKEGFYLENPFEWQLSYSIFILFMIIFLSDHTLDTIYILTIQKIIWY